ncbi:MAG: putative lipid II flippase FtsW [Deltaproteobacteria bacterium]|nr:putative lipid II flippase FtsW [Deltaproteobacteria bacterium]
MPAETQKTKLLAYDARLLFPTLLLVGIGVVMVYSASSELALEKFGSEYHFFKKQAIFALLGILALVFYRHVPYRVHRLMAYPLLGIALAGLIAVQFSKWGISAGGSSRWLRIGEITVQPSEFARFALIVYLAYSMDKKGEKLKDLYIGFLPHALVLGTLTAFIILQPDFGSVVILGAITWIMMFVAGARIRHLIISVLILSPFLYLFMLTAQYRIKRWLSFLNPWQFSSTEGYQIIHSMMAFGTGGLWGAGIGKGYQKLFYLPEPHTDFIFSVIGEELGLLGVIAILSLYVFIIWRGIIISRNARDVYGSFLAFGLTLAIGLQVCVNMGVALGLLPTKGLALPFLSYGGTSLLINMASIGILMNIGAASFR